MGSEVKTENGFLSRILRHRKDLWLLTEASCFLVLAGTVIRFLPFRRVLATAGRTPGVPPPDPSARENIGARVGWAVRASAARLPWRPLCFPQGLAAQWMLRRRGIDSTFYYGGQVCDGDVRAHVWVADGDVPIVGGRVDGSMQVLVQVPPIGNP